MNEDQRLVAATERIANSLILIVRILEKIDQSLSQPKELSK